MNDIDPVVRHMLVCDDVQPHADFPNKVNVLGLISTVRAVSDPAYPLQVPQLSVYLAVTGGRGTGTATIIVKHADTELVIFRSASHHITLPADPLAVLGLVFRIRDGVFPQPGLYWVEFEYNEKVLTRQPLLVR